MLMTVNYPRSAYLHIPFCRRRCYYCDFPISVVGDRTDLTHTSMVAEYVDYLCREIKQTPTYTQPLQTVFFGGGTPSLLPVKYLGEILEHLEREIGIATDAEISLEVDPGTFDRQQLQAYRNLGINRLSLGVQAFQPELLQVCGRSHTLEDVWQAIALIQEFKEFDFSLDLISGLPHQNLATWADSLERAIQVRPDHLSCYDLVLESVTAFGKRYQSGQQPLPTEQHTARMYKMAQQRLTEAGYEHYEISNYAQPGYQCHHNLTYWQNLPYYGFGMGAASYTNQRRYSRPRTRQLYFSWVAAGCPIAESPLGATDLILESLMLGLRLAKGVSLVEFEPVVREKIAQILSPYQQKGYVLFEQDSSGKITRISLQDPQGFLISNTILSDLFAHLG